MSGCCFNFIHTRVLFCQQHDETVSNGKCRLKSESYIVTPFMIVLQLKFPRILIKMVGNLKRVFCNPGYNNIDIRSICGTKQLTEDVMWGLI